MFAACSIAMLQAKNSNKTWQIRDVLSGPNAAREKAKRYRATEGNDLGPQGKIFSQEDNRNDQK